MKIVVATPIYPPEIGGPATYVQELLERMKVQHDITVIAYSNLGEEIEGTKLIKIKKRRALPIRLFKFTLELFKASKGADIIYAQNAVAAGLPAVIAGGLRGIPVIIRFVGDEAWERATQLRMTQKQLEDFLQHPEGNLKIRLIMMLQGFVLRRTRHVITPSEYLSKAIINKYRVRRETAVVNYNAAEKPEIPPFETKATPHQIVATARLVEWKGLAGIIRATAILKNEFPDVHFLIAGDGPEENNLKTLTKEYGVTEQVAFLGRVSRAETWHIRKNSEVYVLNSNYEGLPHVVLTSFAAEIPVVATNIPGTNEAVYHEKTGLLVEPGDDTELAFAIARLFKDSELRLQLIVGAKKLLAEKFSWETHIKILNRILKTSVETPVLY